MKDRILCEHARAGWSYIRCDWIRVYRVGPGERDLAGQAIVLRYRLMLRCRTFIKEGSPRPRWTHRAVCLMLGGARAASV
jgi:hypothetical protein